MYIDGTVFKGISRLCAPYNEDEMGGRSIHHTLFVFVEVGGGRRHKNEKKESKSPGQIQIKRIVVLFLFILIEDYGET